MEKTIIRIGLEGSHPGRIARALSHLARTDLEPHVAWSALRAEFGNVYFLPEEVRRGFKSTIYDPVERRLKPNPNFEPDITVLPHRDGGYVAFVNSDLFDTTQITDRRVLKELAKLWLN